MKKVIPAANPEAYVDTLGGWRRECVESLRGAVWAAGRLGEVIKWGHLVYFSNGPVLLIRAEEARVLFGFWRGQRLREIEPKLKPGGKYEMATWELREGDVVDVGVAKRLVLAAVELNQRIGDPTAIGPSKPAVKKAAKKAATKKAATKKAATKKAATKKAATKKAATKKAVPARPAKKAATRKAAAGKPSLSPSGSAQKTPR